MTARQKKQFKRGYKDGNDGVEHKDGRGKFYDLAYSEAYSAQQSYYENLSLGGY